MLAVGQVQRQPLDRLQLLLGGRVSFQNRKPPNRPIHMWTLSGQSAREVARLLLPHMSPRRQAQFAAALDKYDKRPLFGSGRRASIRINDPKQTRLFRAAE
jgi:hypothetical protein